MPCFISLHRRQILNCCTNRFVQIINGMTWGDSSSRFFALFLGGLLCLAEPLSAQNFGPKSLPETNHSSSANQTIHFPLLALTNQQGISLPLFSSEAYAAEFRHLRSVFGKIDLAKPGIKTDGWTYNISEAEWPFMGLSYLGYACANFAECAPAMREESLQEIRWIIEALQTPRMSGFMVPHFGEPFGTNQIHIAVFVHGHFLNLVLRYREVSGDNRYDALIHRIATALAQDYLKTDQGILRSYRDMWWITDNFPALSALSRYDRIFKRDTSAARKKFLSSLNSWYLDKDTGMICTYINPNGHVQVQGARGISVMYGLHFLKDFDARLAVDQYALAKKFLVRRLFGVTTVREFPEGSAARADIDSGPLIFGVGPSASGFAIAAAAVNGDVDTAWELLAASAIAGLPSLHDDELQYAAMPPVGQAVILFGKSELMKSEKPAAGK